MPQRFDFRNVTWWQAYMKAYFPTLQDVVQIRPPTTAPAVRRIRSKPTLPGETIASIGGSSIPLVSPEGCYACRVLEDVVDAVLRVYRIDSEHIVPHPTRPNAQRFICEIQLQCVTVVTAIEASFCGGDDAIALAEVNRIMRHFWDQPREPRVEHRWSLGPSESDGSTARGVISTEERVSGVSVPTWTASQIRRTNSPTPSEMTAPATSTALQRRTGDQR